MLAINRQIIHWKLKDYIFGESIILRSLLVWGSILIGCILWLLGRKATAFQLLGKSHAVGGFPKIEAMIERWIRWLLRGRTEDGSVFFHTYQSFLSSYCENEMMQAWVKDPHRLLGSRIIVVKAPSESEKGVIIIDYSYVFPLFRKIFDVERIVSKYHLVLEPSWSGFCNLEILNYASLNCPVFIQASEPRDADFIDSLHTNLITVPISSNWWIDHRVARPDSTIKKDKDLIMVAAWAGFKRHWSFFECLSRIRRKGRRLAVTLVGYPLDSNIPEITAVASRFGVQDQLEIYEWLSSAQVMQQLNRAKAFVLWSRREGVNKAIIEAMLADLPVIIHQGFNYGYHYPYINDATGTYATKETFEDVVLGMLENYKKFSPRAWIMSNMTCQHATDILQQRIRETSEKIGEVWTRNLVVKTKSLNGQSYWNESERKKFDSDYRYLSSCLR